MALSGLLSRSEGCMSDGRLRVEDSERFTHDLTSSPAARRLEIFLSAVTAKVMST